MTARDIWIKNRIIDVLEDIKRLNTQQSDLFVPQVKPIAEELLYLSSEWEKYFKSKKE